MHRLRHAIVQGVQNRRRDINQADGIFDNSGVSVVWEFYEQPDVKQVLVPRVAVHDEVSLSKRFAVVARDHN